MNVALIEAEFASQKELFFNSIYSS